MTAPTDRESGPGRRPSPTTTTTDPTTTDHHQRGFEGWLAALRIPAAQQRRVHQTVNHHLSWCSHTLPTNATAQTSAWCYLQKLQHDGFDDTIITMAWAALQLYLDYLHDTHPSPAPRQT